MFVKVVPALRLPKSEAYDYRLPPGHPTPEIGALVRVFFRTRRVPGLVIGTAATSDLPARKIKDLIEVFADGKALVTAPMIDALERLATHYNAPLPLLLLQLLPKIPAKTEPVDAMAKEGDGCATAVEQPHFLYDAAVIGKKIAALAAARPLLILAPTVAHAEWLKKTLAAAGLEAMLYASAVRPRQGFPAWTSLASRRARALITTRSGGLAPLPEDGALVIFADEEPSFVQFDAEPRLDARLFASVRARAENRELFIFGEAPTFRAVALAEKTIFDREPLPATVVNLADERRGGFYGIFTDAAREAIARAIKQNFVAVVCVNRRGAALAVRCADCLQSLECRECHITLRSFGAYLKCPRCAAKTPPPTACPACGGARLRDRGLTLGAAEVELKKLFPAAAIHRLEAADAELPRAGIILGTEALVHSARAALEALRLGAVVIPSAEQLFGLGDYADSEEGYALLRALAALAARQSASFVLQTYAPETPAIRALVDDPEIFYKNELRERDEFHYPPSWLYVKIQGPMAASAPQTESAIRRVLPPGADLDETEKNTYIARFKSSNGLLPTAFRDLPPDYRWRVDPRISQ